VVGRPAPAPGPEAEPGLVAFQAVHNIPEITDYIESLFIKPDLYSYHISINISINYFAILSLLAHCRK
jgi:hypothetical protein